MLCTCGADARWLHFAVLRFAVINNAWDTELTGTDCCGISAALRCLAVSLFKNL